LETLLGAYALAIIAAVEAFGALAIERASGTLGTGTYEFELVLERDDGTAEAEGAAGEFLFRVKNPENHPQNVLMTGSAGIVVMAAAFSVAVIAVDNAWLAKDLCFFSQSL